MNILGKLSEVDWGALMVLWGTRLVGAALVLVIGMRVARWISTLAGTALTRAEVEITAVQFLRKSAYVILLIVVLLAVLQVIGVPMTSMIAVLGAAGLAIGLALKDSLSNIASGVMLVTLKPFRVGDVVRIGGETGTVEAVSILQTKLRGTDNQLIVLPNSLITTDSIVNLTPDVRRRIELVIGIGYDDDIDLARRSALEVMNADDRVLKDPAPDVLVYELADSSVNLGIRCHVANDDYFVAKCQITEGVKKAFDAAGVSIPYPQRDLHLIQAADSPDGDEARSIKPSMTA